MIEFVLFMFAAFIAGILTFMAPCTLPVLPAYFAYSSNSQHRNVTRETIYFGLGMAGMFTILGITAGSLGKVILIYKREIVYLFSSLFIIFGVLIASGKKITLFPNLAGRKGLRSLGFGTMIGLTWTGCIGPVLGFMLILAAQTKTLIGGGLLLFIYALGLVFPLILLSMYFDRLPLDGRFWKFMQGKILSYTLFGKTYHVHSTSLLSGILFVFLGVTLLINITYGFVNIFPDYLTQLVFHMEDWIFTLFGLQLR